MDEDLSAHSLLCVLVQPRGLLGNQVRELSEVLMTALGSLSAQGSDE